ncbi:MAG: PAS domain S-box protein [Bacteroidales bacterium]
MKKNDTNFSSSNDGLTSILDGLDSLVYVVDFNTYEILFINKNGRDIWGDILGQKCWQTIQADQVGPCSFCTSGKLLSDSGIPTGVYQWQFQNTVTGRWYDCRDQAIPWKNKGLVRMEIAIDITDRKQAEEKLLQSEENFRSIFENNSTAMAIIEHDTTISMVNEEYCKVGGFTREEVIGTSWTQQIPPPDLERLKEYNRRRLINPKDAPDKYDFTFYKKNGEIRHSLMSITMLKNRQIIASFIDVTEQKRIGEKIRYQSTLLENVSDALIATDIHYNIQFWNKSAELLYGWTSSEVIGQPLESFIINDYLECSLDIILRKILQEGYWKGEITQNHRDGTRIPIISTVSVVKDDTNQTVGFIALNRDITERKQAERLLKESEKKYRSTLNASPDGIVLTDIKGIITDTSDIAVELLGADLRDELVGLDFFSLIPADEKHKMDELIERTMNEGIAQQIETTVKKKNQSVFLGEISSTLIQGLEGAPLSFMIMIRDISQRKKMETKQIHADHMANIGEMASGLAHEINQPLNIISMVMDKLLFEAAKTETIDFEFFKIKSEKIFENIIRIRNIIDNVKAFSRSDDDYVVTTFNINSSIEDAVSLITAQFEHLGISLNLQLEKKIPNIHDNTYKFKQVIINLLTNAKDAVIEKKTKQDESFDMIVSIRSYLENQFIIVEIADNGIGISKDDIHNVMLPFYTTKDTGEGVGLGLSICYQIMKEMGGTIEITSDSSSGTKIKLVLPEQKKM